MAGPAFVLTMASSGGPASNSSAEKSSASPSTSPQRPVVFVAGSTGNVGSRLVRLLAADGYPVRAASRDSASLFPKLGIDDSNGDVDTDPESYYGPIDRRNISPVTLDVAKSGKDEMRSAIGADASVVVSALGAPFSWGKVDGAGIANLMKAACELDSVKQLIVVSSIGVGRPWAFPAGALNLFGGVLLFKDFSEQVLRKVAKQSNKSYLIVRPGGMESPTDEFGQTHNVKIEPRNSLAGGLVSNLQIAQLIKGCIENPQVATNKTIEVVAETTAPDVEVTNLIDQIASDK